MYIKFVLIKSKIEFFLKFADLHFIILFIKFYYMRLLKIFVFIWVFNDLKELANSEMKF